MPEADRLWEAQPALVRKALDRLEPRVPGTTNVYSMAIAAQGSQTLFSREAKFAQGVISARFKNDYRGGILLSNGAADLMRNPLATGGNIASVVREVAGTIDPSRDVFVIYLTSHGGPDAALSTDLPDYQQISPIWAGALAAILDRARIRRRVVIVSACYSATWIPALANADTIVITAAAKDRTSFGCSDDRRLTYFGEAFLEGPLSRGASLQQAFDSARKTVAKWERDEALTPSLPQAFVGKNMQALWVERAGP
jgi:hypothetical protein